MQKLRPYLLPGLFVFHPVLLFAVLAAVSVATDNRVENVRAPDKNAFLVLFGMFILFPQLFLTALFAGLGPGSWSLRIPSWGALATLSWLTGVFTAAGILPRLAAREVNEFLSAFTLVPLIGWGVLVTLLLILRVVPFLKWRIALQPASPELEASQPRQDSLTRGILVVVATWAGILMLLKDSWLWSTLVTQVTQSSDDLLPVVGIAALVGAGSLVLAVMAVGLTLSRFADWMFYRRSWTLRLLAGLAGGLCVLGGVGAGLSRGMEAVLPVGLLVGLLMSVIIALVIATRPVTALLVMGMAGYRLAPRKQREPQASQPSSPTATTRTKKPAENWFLSLQSPHVAALICVLVFFVGLVPTGAINQHRLTINSGRIVRNKAGEILRLELHAWATDVSLESLQGRTELRHIHLANTQITDGGLVHLKEMTKLEALLLDNTQINGSGLVHLTGMTNLRELTLYETQVTDAGLVHLKGLTNLETLSLDNTNITDAGLLHLKDLTNLERLNLNGCEDITDAGLMHLKGLSNLQDLDLRDTRVSGTGLVHFEGMTQMRLFLGEGITDAELVHLKGLYRPPTLSLEGTQITAAGLVHLKGMDLRMLDIPREAQTDLGLKHYLAAVEPPTELSLYDWNITDGGLVHLKGLAGLQTLILPNTQITDAGLAQLSGMNLTALAIPREAQTDLGLKHYLAAVEPPATLRLNDWNITDAGLVHLTGLNLKELSIPKQARTDLGLKHYLAAVEPSATLRLNGWRITEAGLVQLKGLTNLQKLYLTDTQITDAGLVQLKGLTSLQTLALRGTAITDAGVAELKQALPKCQIRK